MAEKLQLVTEHVAGLLPAQGPITSFAFLNTLQALESLPFRDGLRQGAALYHCQPYLPEESYHRFLAEGRIELPDLQAALRKRYPTDNELPVFAKLTRHDLRLAMLQHSLYLSNSRELQWFVAETDALLKFRSDVSKATQDRLVNKTKEWVKKESVGSSEARDAEGHRRGNRLAELGQGLLPANLASLGNWTEDEWCVLTLKLLWRVCHQGVQAVGGLPAIPLGEAKKDRVWRGRHRNSLLIETGLDSDSWVHETLIRFSASFVDQGFAGWKMPYRDNGFFSCFVNLLSLNNSISSGPNNELVRELRRIKKHQLNAAHVFQHAIEELGVAEEELERFVAESVLALRGWAGMIWQLESRPDRAVRPLKLGCLQDFIAVRLLLDTISLKYCLQEAKQGQKSIAEIRPPRPVISTLDQDHHNSTAFSIFQVAQITGVSAEELSEWSRSNWENALKEVETFNDLERRSILQDAYERHYRVRTLESISIHTEENVPERQPARFQAVFCIDAREESLRRHLEELEPRCETYGTAGFFGIPIRYKGVADATYASLCPIVLRPKYWVNEEVVFSLEEVHERRAWARRTLGTASHRLHVGSRTFTGGAIVTTLFGSLASIPLIARILFPSLTARLKKSAGVLVEPPPVTRLRLERESAQPGPGENEIGLSLAEMVQHCETALRDIGLTSGFAGIVFWIGHGSQCMNNPHESAYDCGACSGNSGGPNARLLAAMLNDNRIREQLVARGISIPIDTYFVAAQHNTCNDSMIYYDLAAMPSRKVKEFKEVRKIISDACMRNSHERCRQFETADLAMSFSTAHRHVEARSEDLAQTRPEYGNASNALCLVGRRSRFRGLFFGRRAFMMSYDPTQDDANCTILARILSAVVPVCSGINMQYTLSAMDPVGWGCGSKLPHNITSLLGVMDGAMSDLRTGLPLQGTDIHEPMRLLFVIETTPDSILSIMQRNETIGKILGNGWAQLAVLDPNTRQLLYFDDGVFSPVIRPTRQLPTVEHSLDWYGGKRHHLDIALVRKGLPL